MQNLQQLTKKLGSVCRSMKKLSDCLREDVTRDMLADIIDWYLHDLRSEQAQAEIAMRKDSQDVVTCGIATAYQFADEMLFNRLSGLLKEDIVFLGYPPCSTCKKANSWLVANGINVSMRNIKADNPSAAELKVWHEKSGLPLKKFFNTSGLKYKELGLKDKLATMSEGEQYELLASDGMLVKRPLLITNDAVLIGFKEKEWADTLTRE